ncbi:hypothetical protein BD626DRAFT_632508 [Schizophyllum amplum]|uniref:Uncharacterized protein n=1 Tax=Schizophyllum amplum TaxID=97359 RepID=A0A550C6F4_9AGAR|nr:hypothetical protein BD626DRAFT_632508 [Auriculariopsis ampla]
MASPTRTTQAILRRITDSKYANLYTREGVRVMRTVVDRHRLEMARNGLTTQQLFELAQTVRPSSAFKPNPVAGEGPHPPNPAHPIRSMSQAKRILDILSGQRMIAVSKFKREVEATEAPAPPKGQQTPAPSTLSSEPAAPEMTTIYAWRWLRHQPHDAPPEPVPQTKPYGWQLGVGDDRSHLNRRRQRARGPKVRVAVTKWKKEIKPQWLQEMRAATEARTQAQPQAATA